MEEREIIRGSSGKNRILGWILILLSLIFLFIAFKHVAQATRLVMGEGGKLVAEKPLAPQLFNIKNGTFDLSAILFIVGYFFVYISKNRITVTDKRVYGRALFKRQVDLPLDSISAVETGSFGSISVATSSGRISFIGVSNRDEIHKAITELIIDRQSNPVPTTQIKQEIPFSSAYEIIKFKDLLDKGVITKEEFEAKKKQLLGL